MFNSPIETSNSSANKRIAKNTLVLYIRMLFVMGVTLYTSRIVLAELGVTDYGIYNVVGSVVTIFSFISQALGNATNRFIVFSIGEGDIKKTEQVYNTCFRVHIIIALIVVLILETIGLWFLNGRLNIPEDRYTAAILVFHVSVAVCFLSIIRVPSTAEVVAHENMGFYALISILETILKFAVAIYLQYLEHDKLIIYAILLLLVQVFVNISYHFYCRYKYEECRLSFGIKNDSRLYRQIGSFAGWSMFGNVVWLGYTQGINLMLNIFWGPAVNAARGIAAQVENAVASFVSSFQTALNPQITKSYAQGNLERMHSLIVYSSKFSLYLYLVIAVPIFCVTESILGIWLVEVPEHTANFVRLTLLYLMFLTIGNPLGTSNDATGKIRNYQIVCGIINLQIIVISYFFLKLGYEPEVVFYIQVIVYAIQIIARLLFIRKQVKLSLRYYIKTVVKPALIVILISVFSSLFVRLFFDDSILSLLVFLVVSASIVFFTSYLCGLNKVEKQIALAMGKNLYEKLFNKKKSPTEEA